MSKIKASTYLKAAEKCRKLMFDAIKDRKKLKELDEMCDIGRITLKDDRDVDRVSELKDSDEIRYLTIDEFRYGPHVILDYPTAYDEDGFDFSIYDEDVQFELGIFSIDEIKQLARRGKVIIVKGNELEIKPKAA